MAKYTSVRGMEDIMAPDIRIWQEIESLARRELEAAGYSELRTPALEETALFVRGIGETTDIVSKEMYTFSDRKGRSLSLRPEGTAPIVRAYIEHGLNSASTVHRIYYIGPMFRSERPQKGRSRQFHQIGVEVIGSNSVFADVEVIAALHDMLKAFGLSDFRIRLNSLGCKADKAAFGEALRNYLDGKRTMLCDDCKARIDKNVLRVLDCKNEACQAVVRGSPDASGNLCGDCKRDFDRLKEALKALHIPFEESKNLVRGLDYYTGTVFEVSHPALGAQDAIAAGGRYDNLVRDMGGPDVGAVGYALGVERVVLALKSRPTTPKPSDIVYVATMDDSSKLEGMRLAAIIRRELPGVTVLTDISEASLKSQMRNADKKMAKAVLILGEEEVKSGKVTVKAMDKDASQVCVERSGVIDELRRILC